MHGKKCPTYPRSLSINAATLSLQELSEEVAEDCDSETLGVNIPLVVNCAGVSCVAWSSEGKKEKGAHMSEVAHHIWHTERTVLAERGEEDLSFMECVWQYPVEERLCVKLAETHLTIFVRTGSFCFAWPHDRDRVQAAMLNRRKLVWLGPMSQEDIEADFRRRFYRRPMLGGSALLT